MAIYVGLAALPGAGKGEFVRVARAMGFAVVRMGDFVWQAARALHKTLTDELVGKVADEYRKKYGRGVWAEKTLPHLPPDKNTVIDGLRSPEELDIFRANLERFVLVYVHAPPRLRFRRIQQRARVDDVKDFREFRARDARELRWGLGEVRARADFKIVNDKDLEKFRVDARALLASLLAG